MHRARRVVFRNIERLKVVKIVFDFGAISNLETHADKQTLEPLECARDRMQSATCAATPWQGHINLLTRQRFCLRRRLQDFLALGNYGLQLLFGKIHFFAKSRSLLRRQATKPLQLLCQYALLAQIANAELFQRCLTAGCGNRFFRLP